MVDYVDSKLLLRLKPLQLKWHPVSHGPYMPLVEQKCGVEVNRHQRTASSNIYGLKKALVRLSRSFLGSLDSHLVNLSSLKYATTSFEKDAYALTRNSMEIIDVVHVGTMTPRSSGEDIS